jgi:TatD DNase family protein
MNLIDTHCHIQESDYQLDRRTVMARAHSAGVKRLICVGTSLDSSHRAAKLAAINRAVYAMLGVHPHQAKDFVTNRLIEQIAAILNQYKSNPKIVGLGEIGLDYYYQHSPRSAQIEALNQQIDLAVKHHLPIAFHVRQAFDDFWPIFNNFAGQIRGVLHSFTDSAKNLEKGLSRGLYIGVNGIITFNKNPEQAAMYHQIPLNRMLLETDAPFLTPRPFRGRINEPAFLAEIAEFVAHTKHQSVAKIAEITSDNAEELFNLPTENPAN